MNALATASDLTELAKSHALADRERLLLGIIDLCSGSEDAVRRPETQILLSSILMDLVSHAEHDIRRLLSEKLAGVDWAPRGLITVLAHDDIDIARPVIAESPLLDDADLVRILIEATVEHRIEVAQRPSVGGVVVATILNQSEPDVLTALAGNDTADLSPDAMRQLVAASQRIAAMRSPLARHPRLTTDLAQQLYAWVGQSLRTAILARFRVDHAAFDAVLSQAVSEAASPQSQAWRSAEDAQLEMELRLIAKLQSAGQLRPGYLLRALREHKLTLFETALAVLGGYERQAIHQALAAPSPELLALACAGVGVDRGAFATILALVRDLNHGCPVGGGEAARRIFQTYGEHRVEDAAEAFRQAAAV